MQKKMAPPGFEPVTFSVLEMFSLRICIKIFYFQIHQAYVPTIQMLNYLVVPNLNYCIVTSMATSLLQNTFIVSAGKVSLLSALQVDTIYTIRKGGLFSIGCCQLILKIIIGIDWLKAVNTNKCHAGQYSRHYWYRLS
jgi:type III secretory pathway component EscU